MAVQTELLEVEKHQKVLEVGTGSGYQTAVLIEMGARVFTVERQKELFQKAQENLLPMGYKPTFHYGDGYEGMPAYAPFDRILVTAGAREVPEKLKGQLAVGGKMVIPVGGSLGQKMVRVTRTGENNFEQTEHGYFSFVPLLKGKSG